MYNDERSAWECLPGRSASALECGADVCSSSSVIHVRHPAYWSHNPCHLRRGASRDACQRGALARSISRNDRSHALRGNAAQDAPRPLWNVAQMCAQAPALSTSCARLTESAIRAICDAERHGRHVHAERWARSVWRRTLYNDERRVVTITDLPAPALEPNPPGLLTFRA